MSGQEGVAWEELQVVRGERDQAVSQEKDLHQTVTGLNGEKQVRGLSGWANTSITSVQCTTTIPTGYLGSV